MLEELKYTLDLVCSWLRYAERKNAALLGLTGAGVFGLLRLQAVNTPPCWLLYTSRIGVGLMLVAIVLSLSSFLPRTVLRNPLFPEKYKEPIGVANLLYFADLRHFDVARYLTALSQATNQDEDYRPSELEKDVASQIIAISRIASAKFRIFAAALLADILAVAALAVSGFIASLLY